MKKFLLAGSSFAVLMLSIGLPAVAQETEQDAYFRLGLNGSSIAGTPPTVDDNDTPIDSGEDEEGIDPSIFVLTYQQPSNPVVGQPVTVMPNPLPTGYSTSGPDDRYLFDMNEDDFPVGMNPTINETTGALTFTPISGGTTRIPVKVYATQTADGEFAQGLGHADVEVPADYRIDVANPSFTLQDGEVGANRTFVAETVPPQPSDGETWSLVRSQNLPRLMQANGNSTTFDFDAEAEDTGIYQGEHWFQFSRKDASGNEVLSKPVQIEVTPAPYFVYGPETQDGEASGTGYSVSNYGSRIRITSGMDVHIPAIGKYGATTSLTSEQVPAWLADPFGPVLPFGLEFEPDGDIVGSTDELVDENEYRFVVGYASKPGQNGSIFGSTSIQFVVEAPDPYDDNNNDDVPDGAQDPLGDLDGDDIPNGSDPDIDGDGIPNENEESFEARYYWVDETTYWWDPSNVEITYPGDLGEDDPGNFETFRPQMGPYSTSEAALTAARAVKDECMDPYGYSLSADRYEIDEMGLLRLRIRVSGPINLC